MYFEFSVFIDRPVNDVFNFFWTLDEKNFSENKLVPVYEMITEGPRGVGSVIREIVKTPYFTMEIFSEITEYILNQSLSHRFYGSSIVGSQRYLFRQLGEGTQLIQQVRISFNGLKKILNPFLPLTYGRMVDWRLKTIKKMLEMSK